ncbi:MAG: metallophosphoesterase [Clostridia bacterium]|nr:metallophosphoesterase [Clostridia bacterium]
MRKKIFAVSDIHGHYKELKFALENAGFVPGDETQLLIVCGDCFDRGSENRLVFEYLNAIQNKILIKGNHEDMLALLMDKKHIGSGGFTNGIDCTLRDFFGDEVFGDPDPYYQASLKLHFEGKEDIFSALHAFMDDMYDYFETEHYVFTHGWLPCKTDDAGICSIKEDFRYEQPGLWERARFTEWYRRYQQGAMLEGKTIVCGHRTSRFGCLFDGNRNPEDFSIFHAPGLAAIDTSTVQSKQVNVLVIEDEEITSQTHAMSLKTEPFLQIRDGEKRVEMRLLDQKRKKIRVGDRIVFTHTENKDETVCVCVVGLHAYSHFNDMAWDFSDRMLGIPPETENLNDMMSLYYEKEDIYTFGALAIRLAIEAKE